MSRAALTLISLAAAGVGLAITAGCPPAADPARRGPAAALPPPTPLSPLQRPAQPDSQSKFLRLVRLKFMAIDLPLGATGESERLWSYLDEEPVGARISVTLGQNGFRVGQGRGSDWPQMKDVIDRLTIKSWRSWILQSLPGNSVSIALKERQDVQTIFVFRRNRTLFAKDYPPGDNVLAIVPTLSYDDPTGVHMTASALIRTTRRRSQYVKTPAGYVIATAPVLHELPEMEFRLAVPQGGLVLIGPSKAAKDATSPGSAFLTHSVDGVRFEQILVIVPEVVAQPIRTKM